MQLAFAIGCFLVRRALSPLRIVTENAASVTVDKLDTRIAVKDVPSQLEPLVLFLAR